MYDYIIIGAGSAGCVLASRLTEDPSTSVLLLEAGGPDKRQEIHIPAAFYKLYKSPQDWVYETVSQTNLKNRQCFWPRGKMLGGSSSINAMMYIRGDRYDYDQWQAAGNDGWGYDDVLPYFKKSERQQHGTSEYHGGDGPLSVSDLRSPTVLARAFVEAGVELGIPRNSDLNGATHEGISLTQVTQKQGQRHSTAAAFLRPALSRPNLTVATEALAQRVLFEGNRAVGVVYAQNGQQKQETARREVLLCGGAINSPQLLLLSGVGPANHLKELGITPIADLPGVGQNLQDHLAVSICYASSQPVSLAGAETLVNLLNYILFKRGPLTSNVAEAAAFVKTDPDQPAPNLELLFAAAYYVDHGFANPEGHGFTLAPVLLYPQSRGTITLRSTDPAQPPLIDPHYLEKEADLQFMIEGVKWCRRLAQTRAFAPYLGAEYQPGSSIQSDEEIANFVCEQAATLYHPVGTCKMGNDALSVVDSQLRVRGVENLRVVDASIMPTIIGGHTNAPSIMIAERAADLLKQPQPVTAQTTVAD